MNCNTKGLPVHHQLPEFIQTHVHRVGDAIQPSHPLSSPSPTVPSPSQHQSLFRWVNSSHEVAKVLEFLLSIIPSKEHPGLISIRMDWLDLLAVQGTLKSLLQHHSSKASILWCSAFFTVQLSHPYMIIGKTIALTRQTLLSLLLNMLSRLVITFFLRSKHLLISWLQSPSAVILEPPKIKSDTTGGPPQKERGSGTSLSKTKGSRGEVSLLSTNPAPLGARDNKTGQGFHLSSSALLQGKQGGFARVFP